MEKLREFINGIIRYLKEVRAELKMVTWTGRKEVATGTVAVFIMCAAVSIILSLLDIGISRLFKLIFGW
jgi:preprotein translocase subunit SecE